MKEMIQKWARRLTPIDWSFRYAWWGTLKGVGFRGFITLASPLANTILNWKYLDWKLKINSDDIELL